MVNRGGRIVAPAAIVSLVSGLYPFRSLHDRSWSEAEFVLGFGAFAAVLSFFVGAIGSGPAEKRLAQLHAARTQGEGNPEMQGEVAALERRVLVTARTPALLLFASNIHLS